MVVRFPAEPRRGACPVNNPPENNADSLEFLFTLQEESVEIEADVVQVGVDTWAIHGVIPVDGEVLLIEFESYDDARNVLDQLNATKRPDRDIGNSPFAG
jgi:hypothetical protein